VAESPFTAYPSGGSVLLGSPKRLDNCRHGYGLEVRDATGQTTCAYCGESLVDDYRHWLLMAVDHVVPSSEGKRLCIPGQFTGDFINLVLCCSGCNGFGNRYRVAADPQTEWTLAEFVTLRDRIFAERSVLIADRRTKEMAFYRDHWERPEGA
jgi:5-methylcytosine-specific restriction endonuclease McrA